MKFTRTNTVPSRRPLPLSLAAAVALALAGQSTHAADLYWNANPTASRWNQTETNWTPDSFLSAKWDNSTPDSAIFDNTGVAGAVTLGEDITVGNITFNEGGYSIAGGGYTLNLSNTVIGGTANATISASLAGTTGLTITNNNSLGILLTGNNTYSGATIVGTGTTTSSTVGILRVGSVGALGNSTDIRVGSTSALIIAVPNSTSTSVGSGKTLTLFGTGPGSNGALQGTAGAHNTWAGDIVIGGGGSRISGGSGGGTLTISGVISEASPNSWVVFNRIGGSTTVLNAVNTYTGDTQIFNNATGSTSTLKIGVDNAINANSRLTTLNALNTAESVVDLNGHVQTFRGMDTGAGNTSTTAGSAFLVVKNNGATASTLTVGDSAASNRYVFGGALRDGTSTLSLVKAGNNTQVLAGINTYTGSTTINGGTLQVGAPAPTGANPVIHFTGSNGSLASTDIRVNNGSFVLDNTGSDNNSSTRLSDSAHVSLNGGTSFVFRGSESATSQETLGRFTFASGLSTLNLVHGAGNAAVVTVGELSRSTNGGLGFLSGADFGSTGTAASRLIVTTEPTLVGTSDALATGAGTAKDTKIVPFLLASTTNGNSADTFVTYNPTTGLRPLTLAEYENDVVADANVRITSNRTSGTAAINSLTLTGANLSLTGTLTNTSGAFLFTSGTSNISGGILDLGDKEALMTVTGLTAVISTRITGTNGLSLFGTGTLGLGSTTSTYSGVTMLHSGIIVPQSSSTGAGGSVVSGPFGTSTVVFAGSSIRTASAQSDTPTSIGNVVRIQADTTVTFNGGSDLLFTGPVTLAGGTRTLTNNSAKNTIFSGSIGDGGQDFGLTIAGNGAGSVILSGENTYGGPTTVNSSTLNISGSISGSSAVSVNAGTLVLSGLSTFVDRIGNDASFTLGSTGGSGGATLKIDNSLDSANAGAPFEETLGSLTLGNNAVIDLGTGEFGSILYFAESQGNLWTGTLSIYNWTGTVGVGGGIDQIFFGDTQFSLTASQLAQIRFYSDEGLTQVGYGGLLDSGELIAVANIPEPSSMLSLFAMFGGLLGARRMRRKG